MMAPHDCVDAGSGGEAEGDGEWRRPGLAASPSLGRHVGSEDFVKQK